MSTEVNTTGTDTSTSSSTGAGDQTSTGSASSQSTSHIDLSDDALVRLPGQDKPVKFGEWRRGFQGSFTRTAQEKARLEQRLKEKETAFERLQERVNQFANPNASRAEQEEDMAAAIEQLPYLNGQDAAKVVRNIVQQLKATQSEFGKRDYILTAIAKKLDEANRTITQLSSAHTRQNFDSKLNRWLGELGYGPEWKELAEEIYLAYEGDDLDQEFPSLFKKRVEQVEQLIRAKDQRRLQQAKSKPFSIPSRGGDGKAGKPLDTSRMSAKEAADHIWESLHGDKD